MKIAKYWKTIVNTLQDGLMVVDPGGNIVFMNPAAEKLTGYSGIVAKRHGSADRLSMARQRA